MFVRSVGILAVIATVAGCDVDDDPKDPKDPKPGEPLEVVDHPGGVICDETWTAAEYHLESGLSVECGTLVVEACSVIRMPAGALLSVITGGAIEMRGTAECPIVITSAASTPMAGDWSGIEVYADAGTGNVLDHVVVEYAGSAGYGGIWLDSGVRFAMSNSTVRHSDSMGMDIEAGVDLPGFTGNTFTDNASWALEIAPEDVAELGAGTYGPNAEDGVFVRGGTVLEDGAWIDLGVPFVTGGFDIGASLTIEEGAVVRVGADGLIQVVENSALRVAGTAERPVTFQSSASTPSAGDWGGIWVYADSVSGENVIEHALVEHSGSAGYGSLWVDAGASIAVTDSTFRDGEGYGIDVEANGELRDFTGNTVDGHSDGAITISANEVDQLGAGTYDAKGVRIEGGTVDHDADWANLGVPYVVPSGFYVETDGGSAHLTIAAGTVLEFGSSAGIDVGQNAGLRLDGTAAAPVELTSSASTPDAGDWAEIDIYSNSHGAENVFTHAILRYGGSDGYGALWVDSGAKVTLEDVTFEHNDTCDVDANGVVVATNSTFQEC